MDLDRSNPLHNAIAYLKYTTPPSDSSGSDETVVKLDHENAPVLTVLADGLSVAYVMEDDENKELVFVQHSMIEEAGMTVEELDLIGRYNLAQLASDRMELSQSEEIFFVTMGGDFEASLLVLDDLWDRIFRDFVQGDYAAAIPARDILVFGDNDSAAVIETLNQVIGKVYPSGDHLLTDKIFVRSAGVWREKV